MAAGWRPGDYFKISLALSVALAMAFLKDS
jgi:hypothetical protein